jgi:hypothetical protein
MIEYPETFNRSLPAGFDGVFAWDFLRGCFGGPIIMPMDFYTSKAPSFADGVSSKYLYFTMLWMFINFYAISLARRPWRLLQALSGLITGREETRLAKWLPDVLVVRTRWNRQFRKVEAARARVGGVDAV